MGIVEQHGEGIPGRDRSGWDGEITVIREVGRGQVAQSSISQGEMAWFGFDYNEQMLDGGKVGLW